MIVLYLILLPWLLWYAYILVMGLYRANMDGRLTAFTKALALPALIVGYALDFVANWTVAVVLFADFPRSPLELVTDRLSRYLEHGSGWRYRRAKWICDHLLDYFDPRGTHCR